MDASTVAMVVLGIIGAAIAGRYFYAQSQRNAELRRQAAELEMAQAKEALEANQAPPLLEFKEVDDAIIDGSKSLMKRFVALTSFQDVVDWDADAKSLAEDVEQERDRMCAWIESANAAIAECKSNSDVPPHIRSARISKTKALIGRAQSTLAPLSNLEDALLLRIDLTPDNKKEQRALLKELREEKRKLQIRKREVKSDAATVRRQARVASAEAGQDVLFGYSAKMAAAERRSIRRAKEAALQPHEDELASIERQMISLDERIAWVRRFGDDDDEP